MKTSESIKIIAPDLVKALGEIEAIKKDAKNPFLKNKYASLDAIVEGTKKILLKHNLCFLQAVSENGIETTILHNSGEWVSSEAMTIPVEVSKGLSGAQARGVAITYCKRYQLGSILGISTDEDTDGQYGNNDGLNKESIPYPVPSKMQMNEKVWDKIIERIKSGEKIIDKVRKTYTLTADQDMILTEWEHNPVDQGVIDHPKSNPVILVKKEPDLGTSDLNTVTPVLENTKTAKSIKPREWVKPLEATV